MWKNFFDESILIIGRKDMQSNDSWITIETNLNNPMFPNLFHSEDHFDSCIGLSNSAYFCMIQIIDQVLEGMG